MDFVDEPTSPQNLPGLKRGELDVRPEKKEKETIRSDRIRVKH